MLQDTHEKHMRLKAIADKEIRAAILMQRAVKRFLHTAWCKRKPNRIVAGCKIISAVRNWQAKQPPKHLKDAKKVEALISVPSLSLSVCPLSLFALND